MENIYDLANNLERAIRNLPEYQASLAQKEKIMADAEAKTIIDEFTAFQAQLFANMQAGQMPSEEEQDQMATLSAKVEANALVKSYLEAQQALSVYVSDLERIIFKPIQDLNQ